MKNIFRNPPTFFSKRAFNIVAIYLFVSILWIFFSDKIVGSLNISASTATEIEIIKGWLFVTATSLLLYYLIKNSMREAESIKDKLKENEKLYKLISENTDDVIFLIEVTGKKLTYISPSIQKLSGYSPEEILNKPIKDSLTTESFDFFINSLPERIAAFESNNESASVQIDDIDLLHKNNSIINTEVVTTLIQNTSGKVTQILGVARDISVFKRSEEVLRESEKKFRQLFMNQPHPMWIYDVGTLKFIEANDAAVNQYGYSRDEFLSMTISDICPREDVPLLLENIKTHNETFQKDRRWRNIKKDGSMINVEVSSHSLPPDGNLQSRIVMAMDITEQVMAEIALSESEEKYRSIFDNSCVAILLTTPDGGILSANDFACKMFGRTEEEICQVGRQGLADLSDPRLLKVLEERNTLGKVTGVFRLMRKNGTKFEAEVSSAIFTDKEGNKKTSMIIHDLTDQKEAEEQLKAVGEQMRALASHIQTVREEERAFIAREMHDELGQILSSLKMNLILLHRQTEDWKNDFNIDKVNKEIKSMNGMVDRAVTRVRKLITQLRPELLDKLGLIPALEWYVDEFSRDSKIQCQFQNEFDELQLDSNTELTVFRIVQESLTNISKHSGASLAFVRLFKNYDKIVLEISDNGKGIELNDLTGTKSFGLLGMKERAHIIGGDLNFSGVPGQGTIVKLNFSFSNLEENDKK